MITQPGVAPSEKPKAQFPEASVDSFFGKLISPLLDWLKSRDFLNWLWGAISYVLTRVLGFVAAAMGWAAAKIANILMQAEGLADPAFRELTRTAMKDLMGVDIQFGDVGKPGQRGHHAATARDLGEAVLKGLYGDFAGPHPEQMGPSDAGARKFLTTVTQMAFEGWLMDWTAETLSVGAVQEFGNLDDKLYAALGLGRLSRRALAAPMSILVEQPFTWLLNRTYRPSLLGSAELIRQYLRGRVTRERVFQELAWSGFKDNDIEGLLATHQRMLADTDVLLLVDRGVWTEAQGIQHLRDAGYSEEMARATLTLERERRLDGYRRRAADVASDAFAGGDIDEAQYRRILAPLKLAEWEEQWIRVVAGLRKEFRTRDLSLSDIEQAVKRGILGINDFRAQALKQGYSLADVRTLELLLMTDIKTETEARTARERLALERQREKERRAEEQRKRREEIAAELAVREVSLAQMEAMVRRGIRSLENYRALLRDMKYSPGDVSALAELLEDQIEEARAAAEERERLRAEAARRKVSIGDLERAVKLGIMSVDEYRSQLAAAGFGDEERDLLAGVLQRELDLAEQAEIAREEARRRLAERRISLDDLERAVRRGIRTVESYRRYLVEQGFVQDDADLMTQLLRAEIADDAEARKRREEIEAALRRKKISLSEMEQAVRAGLRTMADYRALLLREGYSEADADLLARLLQLRIDADREAAAKRKEAEERLARQAISLSDLERAVKVGVVDVATYKAALRREGFSLEDQRVLVELLMAELAAVRGAEKKRREAEAAAKRQQISLADLERAVRAGVRPMVEYRLQLQALGYGLADQETLVELLARQMNQDQAARRKREEAERELAVRGLSLAQMERAVLEGLKPLAEYRAWLTAQGYRAEDAAVLVALLAIELAERAAREQGPAV